MTLIEHLRDAHNSLEMAREEAGMGTALMIDPILSELSDLINRTENIQDEGSN